MNIQRKRTSFRVNVERWTGITGSVLRYNPVQGTLQPWRPLKKDSDTVMNDLPLTKSETNQKWPGCLYIIPNRRCNFHCAYCYAAGTRDGSQIEENTLDVLLEGIYRAKKEGSSIRIVFMGGGEPLLSLKLLERGVRKARRLEKERGVRTALGLVTNGALLTKSVEEILLEGQVDVDVSFEVLKDVQEAQRGEYMSVAENVHRASQRLPIVIRTVATEINVRRLEETAFECVRKYPNVLAWRCDPAIGITGGAFFRAYTRHFIGALHAAEKGSWKLRVENIATRCLKRPSALFCSNLWVAGPTGKIVSCPCDDGTDHGLVGWVNSGGIEIRDITLNASLDQFVHDSSKCDRCFLRWNCAGGCPARRRCSDSSSWAGMCRSHRAVASWVLAKLAEKSWGVDWASRWSAK